MVKFNELLNTVKTAATEKFGQVKDSVEAALLKAAKHASYRRVPDTHLYAIRNEAGLDLLCREEVRHVHISKENYPETFPVFLLLTNDIDDPYKFIPVADMRDAMTFATF